MKSMASSVLRKRNKDKPPNPGVSALVDASTHRQRVIMAVETNDVDALRELSRHGFCDHALRCRVWPKLLHVRIATPNPDWAAVIRPHAYTEQVHKDIQRSLHHFDVNQDYPSTDHLYGGFRHH